VNRNEIADALNRSCHCINVDRDALQGALEERFGESGVWSRLEQSHPHLFADSPVFISAGQVAEMRAIIEAIERVVSLPAYREQVLKWAPDIARHDQGTQGAFFGYDFHLTNDGPRLIEINTNAGGALLLLYLAGAQQACCDAVENFVAGRTDIANVERMFVDMFRNEFRAEEPTRPLTRIAIVDEDPERQFLSPEFTLFRQVFNRHDIDAVVAGPEQFELAGGVLHLGDKAIDLVYNRLTDFYLQSDASRVLNAAYRSDAAVVSPGPTGHALYANKRNLTVLSNAARLRALGVDEATIATLIAGVPATERVTKDTAESLWTRRKHLFFKPNWGFGSRGTYKGAKLTRKTWAGLVGEDYIAQRLVPPSERMVVDAGEERALKLDIRCFTYAGEIQLLGARLYRGQTTNFRTSGGGLAAVFTAPGA